MLLSTAVVVASLCAPAPPVEAELVGWVAKPSPWAGVVAGLAPTYVIRFRLPNKKIVTVTDSHPPGLPRGAKIQFDVCQRIG